MKNTLCLDFINILDWYNISYTIEMLEQGSVLNIITSLIQAKNPLFTRTDLYHYIQKPNYLNIDDQYVYVLLFKLDK